MKKATPKPRTRKKKSPAKKPRSKRQSTLHGRLQSEFRRAMKSAGAYINDPERLRVLVEEASRKAVSMPKDAFKETWAYFQTMLRLVRAYYRGDYRAVSTTTLLVIIGAILYIVNPFDVIPDWVPGLGLLDDAFVLALALQRTRQALDDFMAWETAGV